MSPVGISALALPSGRISTTPVTANPHLPISTPRDQHAELGPQPVRLLQDVGIAEHHLGVSGSVPQVDEDDAAVVTPTRHPSCQRHRLAGIGGPQRTGGMTAQHENSLGMA